MARDKSTARLTSQQRRRSFWSILIFLLTFLFVIRYRASGFSFGNRSPAKTVDSWWRVHLKEGTDLTKVDELKALIYMLTTSDHILPEELDASEPLDLSLLVDGASLNPSEWHQRLVLVDRFNPLVVFSKSYCPYSLRTKALLEAYDLHPPPRIVEVDHRPDMEQIKVILTRLTSRSTWPNIMLKGVSIGGSDELHELHEKGLLRERLEKAGISVGSEGTHYSDSQKDGGPASKRDDDSWLK